jgi:MFS family permease
LALRDRAARVFEAWVGLPNVPAAKRWGVVAVIDSFGTGMRVPVTILYFTVVVGLPAEQVGLGLGAAGLLATVGAPIAGALTDRFGAKQLVVGCFILAAAGYLGYLTVRGLPALIAVVAVAQLADYASKPAKQAFVAQIVRAEHRVSLMAFNRSIRNVGYGVGGLATAGLLALAGDRFGFHAVLVVDGISYLVAAYVVLRTDVVGVAAQTGVPAVPRPTMSAPVTPAVRGEAAPGFRQVLADRRYVLLAVFDVLMLVHGAAFSVGVPLWVHRNTNAPTSLIGLLFAVNTAAVVVFQVRMTKGLTHAAQTPRVFLRAALAFALAAVLYWLAGSVESVYGVLVLILVGAVLSHTLCELLASAAEWTVSFDLAPARLRGRYLSLFSLSSSVQHALGPALVTVLIARYPQIAWFVLAALIAIGAVASALLVRNVPSRQDPQIPPSYLDTTAEGATT